jgi:hypothetical protein
VISPDIYVCRTRECDYRQPWQTDRCEGCGGFDGWQRSPEGYLPVGRCVCCRVVDTGEWSVSPCGCGAEEEAFEIY